MAEIKDKVVTVESLKALHDYTEANATEKLNEAKSYTDSEIKFRYLGTNPTTTDLIGLWNIFGTGYAWYDGTVSFDGIPDFQGLLINYANVYNYDIDYDDFSVHDNVYQEFFSYDGTKWCRTVTYNGNTGATEGSWVKQFNFDSAGNIILANGAHYGDTLPEAGTVGRIFFKKISE